MWDRLVTWDIRTEVTFVEHGVYAHMVREVKSVCARVTQIGEHLVGPMPSGEKVSRNTSATFLDAYQDQVTRLVLGFQNEVASVSFTRVTC